MNDNNTIFQENVNISNKLLINYLMIAVHEINSKERDQFWLREEQEEKRRLEAEKQRREEVCCY